MANDRGHCLSSPASTQCRRPAEHKTIFISFSLACAVYLLCECLTNVTFRADFRSTETTARELHLWRWITMKHRLLLLLLWARLLSFLAEI